MITSQQIVFVCLIVFMLYWFISAQSVKPIQETKGWLSGNWYSILLVIGFLLMVPLKFMTRIGLPVATNSPLLIPHVLIIGILSMVLAVTGLVIAIVARKTLAANWSGAVAILMKLHDEEQILTSHFPEEYPTYKKHTKILIPFVW